MKVSIIVKVLVYIAILHTSDITNNLTEYFMFLVIFYGALSFSTSSSDWPFPLENKRARNTTSAVVVVIVVSQQLLLVDNDCYY